MNPYTLILTLFLVAGMATTAWGWIVLARGRRTRAWPAVDGAITRSATQDDDTLPVIAFRYHVNGTAHDGMFRFPGGTQPSPELTAAMLAKFPAGATVKVHYDPAHPDHATLEPGPARGDWLILALGIIATLFGVAFLLFGGYGSP